VLDEADLIKLRTVLALEKAALVMPSGTHVLDGPTVIGPSAG
jgi:hypothetical protein